MANSFAPQAFCSKRQTLVSNFRTRGKAVPNWPGGENQRECCRPRNALENPASNLLSPDRPLRHTPGKHMNKLLLLLLGGATWTGRGESLPEHYASQGEMIVTQLVSAPFPHPKRVEGHTYAGKLYPAREHYSDSSVAIFIPKGFREADKIDFVVHFHGWKNNVKGVLGQYQLVEQLMASGRNAVLVVPQGPYDAPDSFGGKLEDPGGFSRFMADVMQTLRQASGLQKKDFALGQIVLSGHSGGYEVISAILDHGGLTDHVKEVWLFDALYAQTDKFLAWIDKQQGRFIDIYTEHGGTKARTEELMATLKQRGTALFATKEGDAKPADLQANRLIFIYTDLPHNDVVHLRQEFRDYLKTSCLEKMD